MTLCEFCVLQLGEGRCSEGHKVPKKMRCTDFKPGIDRFCSTPADYASRAQLKEMAIFFGIAGKELKRVLALSPSISNGQESLHDTSTGSSSERS